MILARFDSGRLGMGLIVSHVRSTDSRHSCDREMFSCARRLIVSGRSCPSLWPRNRQGSADASGESRSCGCFEASGHVSGKVFVPEGDEARKARRELADVAIEVAKYILQKTGQVTEQPQ